MIRSSCRTIGSRSSTSDGRQQARTLGTAPTLVRAEGGSKTTRTGSATYRTVPSPRRPRSSIGNRVPFEPTLVGEFTPAQVGFQILLSEPSHCWYAVFGCRGRLPSSCVLARNGGASVRDDMSENE